MADMGKHKRGEERALEYRLPNPPGVSPVHCIMNVPRVGKSNMMPFKPSFLIAVSISPFP